MGRKALRLTLSAGGLALAAGGLVAWLIAAPLTIGTGYCDPNAVCAPDLWPGAVVLAGKAAVVVGLILAGVGLNAALRGR